MYSKCRFVRRDEVMGPLTVDTQNEKGDSVQALKENEPHQVKIPESIVLGDNMYMYKRHSCTCCTDKVF